MQLFLSISNYIACVIMLMVAIFQFRKSIKFTWILLAYAIYHFITDLCHSITSQLGMNNWFLEEYFMVPEWLINGAILLYIGNKKKLGTYVFIGYLLILIACQIFREPGTYWPKHLTSAVLTFLCLLVWVNLLRKVNITELSKLRRFWALLSVTILQSISSFTLLLYEIVPMNRYDFLPSIIISTFYATVVVSYLACIKACLCKKT